MGIDNRQNLLDQWAGIRQIIETIYLCRRPWDDE